MDPKKKKLNMDFIQRMSKYMSNANKDGLGYAAVDKDGKLFGERWWFNWMAWENRHVMTKPKVRDHEKYVPLKEELKAFVELEDEPNYTPFEKYGKFGNVTDEMTAITLHTRFATSEKIFKNTHPFLDEEKSISMVHNGVIRNHMKCDEIRSTCDSERILNKYIEHEIDKNPADVQNMIDELKGSFAVGAFALDRDNKRVLDIWRTTSSLSAAFIKELNCLVFSTSLEDIKEVVHDMDLTIISRAGSIKEDTFQRFNAVTGKAIQTIKYTDTTRIDYNQQYDMYDGYMGHYHTGQRNLGNNHHVNVIQSEFEKRREERLKKIQQNRDDLKKDSPAVVIIPMTPDQTKVSSALPPPVIDWIKLTESQRAEVRELRKSGMQDPDIKEHLERKAGGPVGEVAQIAEAINTVVSTTIAEVDKAKEILKNQDPLNEAEAHLDGFDLNDTRDFWIQKNTKLN